MGSLYERDGDTGAMILYSGYLKGLWRVKALFTFFNQAVAER